MRRSLLARLPAVAAIGLLISQAALAQRAEENVTTDSEDAFGRSIGNESIGIYNEGDVRGFSPIEAGNVRLEGLYFDLLGHLTSRLVEGSTIRVGDRLAELSVSFAHRHRRLRPASRRQATGHQRAGELRSVRQPRRRGRCAAAAHGRGARRRVGRGHLSRRVSLGRRRTRRFRMRSRRSGGRPRTSSCGRSSVASCSARRNPSR